MLGKQIEPLFRHPNLVVAPCEFGHGVFTTAPIPSDTTIEECHHLCLTDDECDGIINDYVYRLEADQTQDGEEVEHYSLPLGFGCIFNHSNDHNTDYWHDEKRNLIIFYTIKDVAAGEQLFINYGRDWWEGRDLIPS